MVVYILNMIVGDFSVVVVVNQTNPRTHKVIDMIAINLATLSSISQTNAILCGIAIIKTGIVVYLASICYGSEVNRMVCASTIHTVTPAVVIVYLGVGASH